MAHPSENARKPGQVQTNVVDQAAENGPEKEGRNLYSIIIVVSYHGITEMLDVLLRDAGGEHISLQREEMRKMKVGYGSQRNEKAFYLPLVHNRKDQ